MWKTVKLEDVCTKITDGSHFSPKTLDKGIPYITVRDVNETGIDFDNCKYVNEDSYKKLYKNGCAPSYGDVLFSKDGTVGKVAIVDTDIPFVVLSSLAILTPNQSVLSTAYLRYVLKSPKFLAEAIGKKTGVAIRRIILKNLKKIPFSYPQLAEQQRIVAKLDAAFVEINTAITNSKVQAENIATLKRKFISKVLIMDVQAKPLGDCCEFLNGYAFKSGDTVETSETQLLRIGNLYENRLDLERKPVFYSDDYANQYSRYVLDKGDIVMTLTGAAGKQNYGYALKIGGAEKTLLLNQRILKLYDFNSTIINQEYLLYFLQSESFLAELHATSNGTCQANLSSDKIKKLKIPVPSLDKQEKAVSAFKSMDSYHHEFFECLTRKIVNLSALKSAILAQELQSEAA